MDSIKKAVILAGGYGTRFLPWSKSISKTMLPLIDMPSIFYCIEEAVLSGIKKIYLIIGANGKNIVNFLKRPQAYKQNMQNDEVLKILNNCTIFFVRQPTLNGTGGALLCVENFLNHEAFAVLNADEIFIGTPPIQELKSAYKSHNSPIIGVKKIAGSDAKNFGIIEYSKEVNHLYCIKKLKEKPKNYKKATAIANVGRYILTPNIFTILHNTKPHNNKEIYLTDAISTQASLTPSYALPLTATRFDLGSKRGYVSAFLHFTKSNPLYNDLLI